MLSEMAPTVGARPRPTRWVVLVVLLLGLLGAAWFVRARSRSGASTAPSADAARSARVIPVLAAPVEKRDVPIYLEGLGSVIAFKTVTVKSQVDGRLDQVVFREGQKVRRGELLAQIDPRPFQIQLHQAEGARARDTAQLRDNQINANRYGALRDRKLVSQQQVDDLQATVGQFQGAVQVDEAQIEAARLNLDYARITSPIDGVTGVRLVDPGNIVRATDPTGIVVITQLDPIAVLFTLPQDDLPKVAEQLHGEPLAVEAYSRDGATKIATGELALVDNQINQATSTIRLKAIFPNAQQTLWPNQFVKTRLLLTVRKGVLVVPATVVQRGPAGLFAYAIGADQTVAARPVEIETTIGDQTIIRRGLDAGEQVVVDGQSQLRPGSKVAVRPSKTPDRPPPASPPDRAPPASAPGARP